MATDYGYGLRLMQGGVDRTGLASMADSLGTPGLDLINKRRQEQALADAIAASQSENIIDPSSITTNNVEDSGFSFNNIFSGADESINSILTEKGQEAYSSIKDSVGDMYSSIMEDPNPFKVDDLSVPIDSDNDGQISDYEQALSDLENEEKMMDIRNSLFYNYVEPAQEAFGDFMSSPEMKLTKDIMSMPFLYAKDKFIDPYFLSDNDPMTFKADGGRVGMANGGLRGLRDSGMVSTSKGYGPAGAGGAAMGPSGNQGGNQGGKKDPSKEVDIDQLEEKQEPVVTVQPAVKPMLDDLMQQQLSPYAPVEEASMIDTLSKYNPLAQTFAINPNLSFNYDIDPNLKDLSDLNAQANLTYSFDKGGSVSGRLSDEGKTLRLSEDDKFIQAENVGDTELYNYLVGGEIMPGLNFEFGLMDDAVMEPGMMSPEDLKFFRLIKDF